jgi:hypothetical protein
VRNSLLGLLCVALSSMCLSQEFPKADVFGGYSYLNIDTNGLTSRQSANGWEAAASGNFNRWFAVEFDVSGYYKTYSIPTIADVKVRDYSYVGGPRLNFRPFFVHALLGGDHLSGSAMGYSASQDGLAGAFGGGVQQKVSGPWSVRVSADYVFSRHNIFGGPSYTQNNFRAGVGIAYSFGSRSTRDHAASHKASSAPEHPASMSIPSLGIMVAPRNEGGAEIVDIASGSVAELANLHVGEVITSVDGKAVNSPMELAAALQNRASGSQVHLGYMFHTNAMGYFAKETVVILK